ncbi:MAG: GNAT family N-acetyltransferase [Lachnospiraceae bacterium]|nr:GNAT family N-acetyltransferase [Lachnospiraceae bacterium]
MKLQGNKIYLTSIEDKDTDLIVKWRNADFVMKNFIDKNPLTPEIHRNWLRNKVEKGLVYQFVIHENETDRPIGSVYLRDVDCEDRSAEYGIFIGEEDALGFGFGTEACSMMNDFAKNELKLSKLRLRLREENKVAHKSYLKCGYEDTELVDGILFMERQLDEN